MNIKNLILSETAKNGRHKKKNLKLIKILNRKKT